MQCHLAALAVICAPQAATQEDQAYEARRAVLNAAKNELRSGPTATKIAALKRIAAITEDRAEARKLGVARTLAMALDSKDEGVVAACIKALTSNPDSSGGIAQIVRHLRSLNVKVSRTRKPAWPGILLPAISIPPFPPLGGSREDRERYEKQLREYKRKERARKRERKQQEEKWKRDLIRAQTDDKKVTRAVTRLNSFVLHLGDVRSDAVVDVLTRSLEHVLARAPEFSEPIVSVLCETGRRDAVTRCADVLADPQVIPRFGKHLVQRMLSCKDLGADKAKRDAELVRRTQWLRQLQDHLKALGKEHGVPVPGPPEEGKVVTGEPWNDWLAVIRPKLPKRLDRIPRRD